MDIHIKRVAPQVALIRLNGKFNIEYVANFEEAVMGEIDGDASTIALDMSELRYIDSSGIGSLIKAMNIAKNKSIDFTLLDIHPDVMAIFKIAFLDKFFNIQSRQDFLKQYR